MMKPPAMTARELLDARNHYDLTTDDLMRALCLSRRMVYYLLAGRRRITMQHVEALRGYLQASKKLAKWP